MNRDQGSLDWNDLRRAALERSLRRRLTGDDVRFDRASRVLYSTDASPYRIEPIGVVMPRTQDDLAATIEIAMEHHVPIVPRGGGTSLSGQSIGPGLVIDFRKHLHRILEVDLDEQWARVEPGVVLAELNGRLAPHGFQFGPDVATIDRANLGGMIGNNSAGARSIRYGKTVDHVLSLDVLLTDGAETTFEPLDEAELARRCGRKGREGDIHRTVRRIVERHETLIRARFPKILRRVSGYNLDELLPPKPFDLSKLIVGSEGTLATVRSAKLRIVPVPQFRGLVVAQFRSLEDALASLSAILSTTPSAVELIDRMILDLAARSAEYRDRIDFVEGRPAAIFLIEYSADSAAEIERGFDALRAALNDLPVDRLSETRDAAQRERIWSVRKVALPLLLALPGARKPVTFVEDSAVDPSLLPRFVARFKEVLHRHGTDGSFYGHASVGCLHIRPLLDLRSAEGVRDMESIAREVFDLVREFGGSMSGEHGDGLARGQFVRPFFGEELYESFCEIKRAFDPENLMNPGKIVDAPSLTENLRDQAPDRSEQSVATVYSYGAEGSALALVEGCNGNALCRREGVGVMCPSYMATREEAHSPRGRANLLRAAFEGRLRHPIDGAWPAPEVGSALDLCLMCKACKTECPSGVDVAKLKSEYLCESYRRRRPPLSARLMADTAGAGRLGSRWAPLSNWVLRAAPTRWFLDRFLGIDRRRKLPPFQRVTLVDWFRRRPTPGRGGRGRVVLIADCFTNHHEPRIGRDAVALLERAGYQVQLVSICCGRALLSKGFLEDAKRLVALHRETLAPFADDDLPILGLEPSCLTTLTDEWLDLLPGGVTTSIARRAALVESWLADRYEQGLTDLEAPSLEEAGALDNSLDVLVHGHCHQKAAKRFDRSVAALRTLAAVEPKPLDVGCCGMAGSFGYEKGHYELSVAVAEERLLPALAAAPVAAIVAAGFSCRTQIADLTGRRASHPVEFIRHRLDAILGAEAPRMR